MNELTSEWIVKAEEDFHSADGLLHSLEVPMANTASFHCQQSAEKYLKAFLTENMIRFEKTHGLVTLLDLCASLDEDFRKIGGDLNSLEGYAVAVRYPGAGASLELAESAFGAAERIRKFIRSKLGIK